MFMKALRRTIDAEVCQQLSRVSRVFAENQVRVFERLDRARRQIVEISDRSADDDQFAAHERLVKFRHSRIAAAAATFSDSTRPDDSILTSLATLRKASEMPRPSLPNTRMPLGSSLEPRASAAKIVRRRISSSSTVISRTGTL